MHIVAVSFTWKLFRGQLQFMKKKGVELNLVSSPGWELDELIEKEKFDFGRIPIEREISPMKDLKSLIQLVKHIRRNKPDIVHTHTAKGGLLGIFAAYLVGAKCRMYHMRGLRYLTTTGLKRKLLIFMESLSCRLAHRVFCVSYSIREIAIKDGVCSADKLIVASNGSSNGVDSSNKFNPDNIDHKEVQKLKEEYRIPEDALVFGFLGRIVVDKGIGEITEAWKVFSEDYPKAYLVLVGKVESGDPVPEETLEYLTNHPRVVLTGEVDNTEMYYALFDVFVFPSHREGFANALLEASAMKLPCLTTTAPGCHDAVVDGETGLIVPFGEIDEIIRGMNFYVNHPEKRKEHGDGGRERILTYFESEKVWECYHEEYVKLFDEKNGK